MFNLFALPVALPSAPVDLVIQATTIVRLPEHVAALVPSAAKHRCAQDDKAHVSVRVEKQPA